MDEGRLAALEKLLVVTVDDLHRQQKTTRKNILVVGADVLGTENVRASKRSRRQNHRTDQKSVLMEWFDQHKADPYPSTEEKELLAQQSELDVKQVEHCTLAWHRLFLLACLIVPAVL